MLFSKRSQGELLSFITITPAIIPPLLSVYLLYRPPELSGNYRAISFCWIVLIIIFKNCHTYSRLAASLSIIKVISGWVWSSRNQ
jgi:hypothetical protein